MWRLNLNTIVGFIQKTMYLSCAQMDVHTLDGQNIQNQALFVSIPFESPWINFQ